MSKCVIDLVDKLGGSIILPPESIVSPSLCNVYTCFNGIDGLVCYMQEDYCTIVKEELQCSFMDAYLVTWQIVLANKSIKKVGSFYNDTVKKLMQHLMLLALGPYLTEMVE